MFQIFKMSKYLILLSIGLVIAQSAYTLAESDVLQDQGKSQRTKIVKILKDHQSQLDFQAKSIKQITAELAVFKNRIENQEANLKTQKSFNKKIQEQLDSYKSRSDTCVSADSLKQKYEQLEQQKSQIEKQTAYIKTLEDDKAIITEKLNALQQEFDKLSSTGSNSTTGVIESLPSSCLPFGNSPGIHAIQLSGIQPFYVFCDSGIAGPGWTVIHRRVDESISFDRDWDDYVNGFGNLTGNFWLGLEKMHLLTVSQPHELYVYYEAYDQYVHYDSFEIDEELRFYQLKPLGKSTGNYGVDWRQFEELKFTTREPEISDGALDNCANQNGGGWWYNEYCGESLTGGNTYSHMMIRPKLLL